MADDPRRPGQQETITANERSALHALARTFDRMPEKTTVTYKPRTDSDSDGARPGDDYNARTAWEDLLGPAGWGHVFDQADTGYWRRPGAKTDGIHATTNARGTDRLKVFSTSTGHFETDTGYDKFGAYAALYHFGALSARQVQAVSSRSRSTPIGRAYRRATVP